MRKAAFRRSARRDLRRGESQFRCGSAGRSCVQCRTARSAGQGAFTGALSEYRDWKNERRGRRSGGDAITPPDTGYARWRTAPFLSRNSIASSSQESASTIRLSISGGASTVFEEKDHLLPFEEAKLYGHNATHALAAYIGAVRGVTQIAELKRLARHP